MDIVSLNAEIVSDPSQIGYKDQNGNWLPDGAIEALINAKTISGYRPLASTELLAYLAGNGRYAGIDTATQSNNAVLKSIAMAAKQIVGRDNTTLDLNDPAKMMLVDALVAGGVLTADDKTALTALASAMISRAEQVWGVGIYVAHETIFAASKV